MHNLIIRLSEPERAAVSSLVVTIDQEFPRTTQGGLQGKMIEAGEIETLTVACVHLQHLTIHLSTGACRDQCHMLEQFNLMLLDVLCRSNLRIKTQLTKCEHCGGEAPSVWAGCDEDSSANAGPGYVILVIEPVEPGLSIGNSLRVAIDTVWRHSSQNSAPSPLNQIPDFTRC